MIPKIELKELTDFHKNMDISQRKLINIRGCNGSGKSTIPILMKETDPYVFEVVWRVDGKEKVVATVFPSYQYAALGHYHSKCGGMDTMMTTNEIKVAVDVLWDLNYNLIMEGIMASTVRQTYIDLFKSLNETHSLQREIIIYNLLPPLQVCLDRIQARNGGKPIKEEQVASKWNTVEKNIQYFEAAGFKCIRASNEGIERAQTLEWFFSNVGDQNFVLNSSMETYSSPALKPQKNKICSLYAEELEAEELPSPYLVIPQEKDIQKYEWYKYYKEPDDTVEVYTKQFEGYWYFITERMNIYWKRVVLGQNAPWTNDVILQDYKFTNVLRDIDRLSLYVRKNILAKIDEPCEDLEERKKDVLFNIMIFRLFVKIESYECIGFIEQKNWDKQWPKAVERLRKRRKTGEPMFTSAYYVFGLHTASPSPDNHDKTENAINLIAQFWRPQLDEIYNKVTSLDMENTLDYMSGLSCVGRFTAYEYCCDLGMITRYCKNHIVEWTNDSYTNVGPGAERGINWIFKNKGNLSNFECIVYLRAVWKHNLQRLGTYEQFISQLPPEMNHDIDLRVIEHCLCEYQKYCKALTGTGRPKEKFTPKTKDINELRF